MRNFREGRKWKDDFLKQLYDRLNYSRIWLVIGTDTINGDNPLSSMFPVKNIGAERII